LTISALAVYGCIADGTAGCLFSDILPVGSTPAGNARWGHSDLAGSLWEWHLDGWNDPYPATCADCATLPSGAFRTSRGGAWSTTNTDELRAPRRNYSSATYRAADLGFRCARQ
jgi:formylglycine-generating enzyme required for sulfatase activity